MVTVLSGRTDTLICTVAVTVTPPAVALAVIVVVPAATPVTRPLLLTVATEGADELQLSAAANAAPN
jgi:hypothetical protein